MKPLHWTAANAKRAKKMGWYLAEFEWDNETGLLFYRVKQTIASPFKSDDEAIGWVNVRARHSTFPALITKLSHDKKHCEDYNNDIKTCRKALLLCAGAKRGDV